MKARAWVAICAGVFIIVLMLGISAFVASLVSTHALAIPTQQAHEFLGQTFVGFGMIVLCGVLGLCNGIWMLRNARPNRFLTLSTIAVFIAALYVLFNATKAMEP